MSTTAVLFDIIDRFGRQLTENAEAFGLKNEDQIAAFMKGLFSDIGAFLKAKKAEYSFIEAIVFFFVCGDEITEDAPLQVSPAIEKYFHPQGPQQLPLKDVGEVVDGFEELVATTLSLFPTASIFSSAPPPR